MGKFNEYSQKATPEDADSLMIYDAAAKANKLSPFSGIWNWIVGKLTNAVISKLETQNKSVIGALNELNSNVSITQNISDFDSKYTTKGRLRILCGIISNVAYVSFDVVWIRIQFKAATNNLSWRIVYGDSPIGEWTQLTSDSGSLLRYERTYGKSLTIKNVRAATHGLIMIEKMMFTFYLAGSTSAGYTVATSALPDGVTVSNSDRSVTIKSTKDQVITCFYAFS